MVKMIQRGKRIKTNSGIESKRRFPVFEIKSNNASTFGLRKNASGDYTYENGDTLHFKNGKLIFFTSYTKNGKKFTVWHNHKDYLKLVKEKGVNGSNGPDLINVVGKKRIRTRITRDSKVSFNLERVNKLFTKIINDLKFNYDSITYDFKELLKNPNLAEQFAEYINVDSSGMGSFSRNNTKVQSGLTHFLSPLSSRLLAESFKRYPKSFDSFIKKLKPITLYHMFEELAFPSIHPNKREKLMHFTDRRKMFYDGKPVDRFNIFFETIGEEKSKTIIKKLEKVGRNKQIIKFIRKIYPEI